MPAVRTILAILTIAWPLAAHAAESGTTWNDEGLTLGAPGIRLQTMPPPAAATRHPTLEDEPPALRVGAGFSLDGEGVVQGELAIDHQLWRTDLRRSAIIASVAIRL